MNQSNTIPVARITVTNELQGVRSYELRDGERLNIGRESSNEIVISDNRVSRIHACLFTRGAKCFATDLFSRNGTTVNGDPLVGDRELHNRDVINIGNSVVVIEIGRLAPLQVQGEVTATGGFTNTKIATVLFRSSQPFSQDQVTKIENAVTEKLGLNVLRGTNWILAAWPGNSLAKMVGEATISSVDIYRTFGAGDKLFGVFVFTMSALLEGFEPNWKVDLLGDPTKICVEFNEGLKPFLVPVIAEEAVIKRLPKEWKFEILATHRLKNDFQPRTFYKVVRDGTGDFSTF